MLIEEVIDPYSNRPFGFEPGVAEEFLQLPLVHVKTEDNIYYFELEYDGLPLVLYKDEKIEFDYFIFTIEQFNGDWLELLDVLKFTIEEYIEVDMEEKGILL